MDKMKTLAKSLGYRIFKKPIWKYGVILRVRELTEKSIG